MHLYDEQITKFGEKKRGSARSGAGPFNVVQIFIVSSIAYRYFVQEYRYEAICTVILERCFFNDI